MPTNDYSQQVNATFEFLRKGLRPFVEQKMKAFYKDRWLDECERAKVWGDRGRKHGWDVAALLKTIKNSKFWRDVFEAGERRGAKEHGIFVSLLDWRHKLIGHRVEDVSKKTAQEVIEYSIQALRCVEAKNEVKELEELLRPFVPVPQPTESRLSSKRKALFLIEPQAKDRLTVPSSEITVPFGIAPSRARQTTDFWGDYHFDFADALNEEIWLLSPEVQQQIQPWETLEQRDAIGAQQAMIDIKLLLERGPLPWVPDLVGKKCKDESGVVIVGHAYAGFIDEYSTREKKMPLRQYLVASSVQDFQEKFLKHVVRGDRHYYGPIQNLCSDLGSASRLCLMDLCRASFVKRGRGVPNRGDRSDSSIAKEDTESFERYVESPQAREWLWRRFASGQAKCVLALGTIAEHGLLRLFAARGMTITPFFDSSPSEQGAWVNAYASRKLSYWLKNKTWLTIRGQVDGIDRVWYVLPVYHPAAHENYDRDYKKTKPVLKQMLDSINS
jgi:hypothetical protein